MFILGLLFDLVVFIACAYSGFKTIGLVFKGLSSLFGFLGDKLDR